MAILAGPASPIQNALVQLTRSQRLEPFGVDEGMSRSSLTPVEMAILQIVKMMNRLMGIVEVMVKPPVQEEDDFMQGWGKEPGDDELKG
jgi:hypothetical protein